VTLSTATTLIEFPELVVYSHAQNRMRGIRLTMINYFSCWFLLVVSMGELCPTPRIAARDNEDRVKREDGQVRNYR
jgi:hypothetical protein